MSKFTIRFVFAVSALLDVAACDFFAARHFHPTRSTAEDPSPLKSFCPPDGTAGLRRTWIDVQRESLFVRYASPDAMRRFDVVLSRAGLTSSLAGRIAESPETITGFRALDEQARGQTSVLVRGWIVRATSYASTAQERRALISAANLVALSNWDAMGAPWVIEPTLPDASTPSSDSAPPRDGGLPP